MGRLQTALCSALLLFSLRSEANKISPLRPPPARLPKYEVGIASGAFRLPDYPASNEVQFRTLALPYVIYRGDFLRADREGGLRGRFFKREYIEFDLSFGAAFPTNSEENEARLGMPGLDWIGEIGPRANIHLVRSPRARLDLQIPVRWVFSTNFKNLISRGWILSPEFDLRLLLSEKYELGMGLSSGPVWTTESLQDYFYEVDPKFATSSRPAYEAASGYLGWRSSVSLSKTFFDDFIAFVGVSQSNYSRAKNKNSPLFRDPMTESYFFGLAWVVYRSDEQTSEAEIPLQMQ